MSRLLNHLPVDASMDQIGKQFIQDSLPPVLSDGKYIHVAHFHPWIEWFWQIALVWLVDQKVKVNFLYFVDILWWLNNILLIIIIVYKMVFLSWIIDISLSYIAERMRSIHGSGARWNSTVKRVEGTVEIEPDTRIKLIRKGVVR